MTFDERTRFKLFITALPNYIFIKIIKNIQFLATNSFIIITEPNITKSSCHKTSPVKTVQSGFCVRLQSGPIITDSGLALMWTSFPKRNSEKPVEDTDEL